MVQELLAVGCVLVGFGIILTATLLVDRLRIILQYGLESSRLKCLDIRLDRFYRRRPHTTIVLVISLLSLGVGLLLLEAWWYFAVEGLASHGLVAVILVLLLSILLPDCACGQYHALNRLHKGVQKDSIEE